MSLTIAPLPSFAVKGPQRQERIKSFVLTPDGSKPAGGYTVLASALGFASLDFAVPAAVVGGGTYQAAVQIGTASTDCTVQYYSFQSVAGSAATAGAYIAVGASDTKLTTNPVAIMVVGR